VAGGEARHGDQRCGLINAMVSIKYGGRDGGVVAGMRHDMEIKGGWGSDWYLEVSREDALAELDESSKDELNIFVNYI